MRKQTRTVRSTLGLLASAGFLLASCGGRQSAIDSAGLQADRLESLWWLFFWVLGSIYVIVMAVLITAVLRRRRSHSETAPETNPEPARERRMGNTIKGAVLLSAVILFIFMIVSFRTGSVVGALQGNEALTIKVTGNQWWWNVEYQDPIPSRNITTANEIHLPVGRVVRVELQSNDVIHSFWLPNLHGKKDAVPNYPTTIYFRPDKTGIFWGQCAEFCGYQHAKMRFMVAVESPEDFEAWAAAQRQTPPPPTDAVTQRGQQIFLTSVCAQCHAIQGTPAFGRVGPNLTHVASKQYIASGSLTNTHEHLRSWITDPQQYKPGIRMPMNTYSEEDLNALVAYIESLK